MAFLFQGAASETDAGSRRLYDEPLCRAYGMEYLGMAANKKEAKKLAVK